MRFLSRSLIGLTLFLVTMGLIALSVASIRNASIESEAQEQGRRPAEERIFSVNVAELEAETATPLLTAYGDLQSAVQLELRAETGGTLMELASGFRDGGRVDAGEVLFRIDPAERETLLALAESDLAAAKAEEVEAGIGLELAEEELEAAQRQRDLRQTALDRSRGLRDRGVATASDLETAELALAAAEQALTGRRLSRAQAVSRIERAAIAKTRAEIARDEAERELDNTVAVAPFGGLLTEVDAVPGRLVSVNEKLGLLIDPRMLEVAFRVSNAEFSRLADRNGDLLPLDITASLEVDGIELTVGGVIDRAGASVGSGQTGRLIYARLSPDSPGLFRPGDFLTVRVSEPPLDQVAVVPTTAVSAAGTLLLLGDQDRLEEIPVRVLRRQGDQVIIGDVPFGRTYVAERLPQLGPGIRVRPVIPAETDTASLEPEVDEMVDLSDEKRAILVARIESSDFMPADVKERLLTTVNGGQIPKRMLERIESGGRGG